MANEPGRPAFSSQEIRNAMLLYAVTDRAWLRGRTLADCVAEALRGGATFVQLREKEADDRETAELARALMPLAHAAGVPFVIDDRVELARAVGADGVHVGQSDAACADARRILGPDAIVGVSAQTVEQARAAQAAGADYLGVGAMFPTSTKQDADSVSLAELRDLCGAVDIPVVAIGGVNVQTAPKLAGCGVDGIAVVSALFAQDDIEAAARELVTAARRIVERPGSALSSDGAGVSMSTAGGDDSLPPAQATAFEDFSQHADASGLGTAANSGAATRSANAKGE